MTKDIHELMQKDPTELSVDENILVLSYTNSILLDRMELLMNNQKTLEKCIKQLQEDGVQFTDRIEELQTAYIHLCDQMEIIKDGQEVLSGGKFSEQGIFYK